MFETITKAYNFVKDKVCKYKYEIAYVVVATIFGLLYLFNLSNDKIGWFTEHPDKKILVYLLYSIFWLVVTTTIFVLIKFINKLKKMEFHKKFFVVALCLGTIYLFASPLLTGSDELAHFCRIYEVSEGNLVTPISGSVQGSVMPKSIEDIHSMGKGAFRYSDFPEATTYPLDKQNVMSYDNYYQSSSVYSPIQYGPQIIGVIIGKVCNVSIYWVGMFGRISGFIFWLVICTLALKILPTKKIFAALILLTPTSIAFATTLSGDMMLNCMVMLFISYIMYFVQSKKLIDKKAVIILLAVVTIIALCKIVYLPIALLILLIPKECFKNKKRRILYIISILLIATIASMTWLIISGKYFDASYANGIIQKDYILSNPIKYGVVIIRTICTYFMTLINGIVAGGLMYNSQVSIYEIFSIGFIVLILMSLFNKKEDMNISRSKKILVIFVMIAMTVLMFTALYAQYTVMVSGLNSPIIEGIQGRYFIPILLCVMLLYTNKKISVKDSTLINLALVLQLPILLTMFVKFIV